MVEVMITLFAIAVVGYAAGKMKYMGGEFDRKLSSLVINWTCPALILSSAMTGELPDRRYILPLLLISAFTYVVLTAAAWGLSRLLTKRVEHRGIVSFALVFGNVGFMGYPVVDALFGHQAVFYAAVLNVVNTFAVFTIGTMMITGGDGPNQKRFNKKVLYSTPMLSAYLSMLIVALGIDNIPGYISQPLTMVGNITVPAALLIIGSSMSQLPLRAFLGTPLIYGTTLLRLCLLPIGVHFLCLALGFEHYVTYINTVVIAMPVATYGTILCLKYNKDTTLIAELTFISTLLSILTIPVVAVLLGK
ncbi:MAG: AEC family transporter [Bacteroidaceae bacterium]|nr:AEC family transporter [Bacteroidaceae bacterium]